MQWSALLPAILGTVLLTLGACLMAVPLGIGAGLYLAEYPHTRLARLSRFLGDVLGGTPSIVFGVFVWGWLVTATGRFSGWAGSVNFGPFHRGGEEKLENLRASASPRLRGEFDG